MATTLEKRTVNAAGLVQGIALAPVFVAIFLGVGFWVGLPLLAALLLLVLLLVSLRLPFQLQEAVPGTSTRQAAPDSASRRTGIPIQFWVFSGFALLYGFCETMNGNWSQLDLTTNLGLSTTVASLAAFGVGLVYNAGVGLPAIFAASAGVAVAMSALSFVVAFRCPSPASLHPRPAPAAVVST